VKDPLDREKPWGLPGQMVVISLAIGLIYLIIRLAAVVPEWGWQVILPLAIVAPLLYYFLAFRAGLSRKPGAAEPKFTAGQRALQAITVVLLAAALSLTVWVAAYHFRTGRWPWD